MQRLITTSVCAFCLAALTSFCYASEIKGTIEPIYASPAEPLEVVLLCPEDSTNRGELVPNWVTTDEAIEYFCNDAEEEMEVAE